MVNTAATVGLSGSPIIQGWALVGAQNLSLVYPCVKWTIFNNLPLVRDDAVRDTCPIGLHTIHATARLRVGRLLRQGRN